MTVPRLRMRDDARLGSGVKRVSLDCTHGTTTRLLLPGRVPLRPEVLRDLLIAVHDVEQRCRCGEALRQPVYDA